MPIPQRWRADEVTDGGRRGRDPGQRAARRTTATSSCRRWSSDGRAHPPHPQGGPRRPAPQGLLRARAGRRPISPRWRRRAASTPSSPRRRSRRSTWPPRPTRASARGEAGLLEGVPVAIKDLFCTKGVLTTAGSHILDGFVPPYEVDRHAQALGRRVPSARQDQPRRVRHGLVQHDLATTAASATPGRAPATTRPSFPAAARAARRRRSRRALWRSAPPAPTPAARSASRPPSAASSASSRPTAAARAGASVAFASSLDQAGAFARTVEDCALMLQAMAGHDPLDSTSADLEVPDWSGTLTADVRGLRIGIPKEYRVDGMPAEIERALAAGCRLAEARRAPSWSRSRCRTPNTRCRPTTSSRRPRRPPTSPATTACATACGSRAATSSRPTSRPAARASAPRSAAGS